jgi:prepilin-type N-terminal cleavage/methylation domain-containing protein
MKITNKQGFSLMELIIVIAIMGIMMSIGLYSLTGSRSQTQLETEAQKVISVIREAQNNALTGKTPQTGTYPCAFGVDLAPGGRGGEYVMKYYFKNAITGVCGAYPSYPSSVDIASYDLLSGVTIDSEIVVFSVPFGVVVSGSQQPISLSKEGVDDFNFCVCSSGKIEEGVCGGC